MPKSFILLLLIIALVGTGYSRLDASGGYTLFTPQVMRAVLPTATATATPRPPVTTTPALPPPPATITPTPRPAECHASYPTVCIPPPPPDLDCGDIPYRNFAVLRPDVHRFDGDGDGVGCET
jgi:hypothetical protein